MSEDRNFLKLCAFIGMLLSAVLFVLSGVLVKILSSQVISILDLLARISLLIAIAFPAYGFVRPKKKGWKITYWIVLVIYILGCVFGVLSGFGIIGK